MHTGYSKVKSSHGFPPDCPEAKREKASCCKEVAADARGIAECQKENQIKDGWWNVLWPCLQVEEGKQRKWVDIQIFSAWRRCLVST